MCRTVSTQLAARIRYDTTAAGTDVTSPLSVRGAQTTSLYMAPVDMFKYFYTTLLYVKSVPHAQNAFVLSKQPVSAFSSSSVKLQGSNQDGFHYV